MTGDPDKPHTLSTPSGSLSTAAVHTLTAAPAAPPRHRVPGAGAAAVIEVPALLSVAGVGRVLSCSPRTVRRRIADGSLPAVLEHGRTMIRGDELRAYIDQLTRYGPALGHRRTRAPQRRHDFSFLTE